jgi:hypothetical protein
MIRPLALRVKTCAQRYRDLHRLELGRKRIDGPRVPDDTGFVSDEEMEPIIREAVDGLAARFPEAPKPRIAGSVREE